MYILHKQNTKIHAPQFTIATTTTTPLKDSSAAYNSILLTMNTSITSAILFIAASFTTCVAKSPEMTPTSFQETIVAKNTFAKFYAPVSSVSAWLPLALGHIILSFHHIYLQYVYFFSSSFICFLLSTHNIFPNHTISTTYIVVWTL